MSLDRIKVCSSSLRWRGPYLVTSEVTRVEALASFFQLGSVPMGFMGL